MPSIPSKPHKAWWLNQDGRIIPVPLRHIVTVCEAPETFGLTPGYVTSVFMKHGEPLGHEGLARREIMKNLIINYGWIRIRYSPRHDRWTVELKRVNDRIVSVVRAFFITILSDKSFHQSDLLIRELAVEYKLPHI